MANARTRAGTAGAPHPSSTLYSDAVLHVKSQTCGKRFKECFKVVDQDDDWFEQKMAVFNWWRSGLNADKSGPGSLDNELRLRPDVRDVVADVLDGLEGALDEYYELATSKSLALRTNYSELTGTEDGYLVPDERERSPSPWSDMTDDSGDGSQYEETDNDVSLLCDRFHGQRVLVETNLETLVRIHTEIKHSGLKFKNQLADEALKQADKDYQRQKVTRREFETLLGPHGEHERFRRYLTKLVIWNSYSENLIQRMSLEIDKFAGNSNVRHRHDPEFLLQKKLLVVLRAYLHDPARLTTIQRRLINANVIRRNRLIDRTRALRAAPQTEEAFQAQPMVEIPALSFVPRDKMQKLQRTSVLLSRSYQSENKADRSYGIQPAPDAKSNADERLMSYPNCPADRGQFPCPFCSATLTDEYTKEDKWRGHVDQDLCAYVCVFKDCESPDDMFASTHEWMSHMAIFHAEKQWVCPTCDKHSAIGIRDVSIFSFPEKALLGEHMNACHATTDPSEARLIIDAGERIVGIQTVACPLCKAGLVTLGHGKDDVTTHPSHKHDIGLTQLEHIATHLHEFALHALPSSEEGLSSLGFGYGAMYQTNGDTRDLMMAIDCFQKVLDITSSQHFDRLWIIQSLGVAFFVKFKALRESSDRDVSILLLQEFLTRTTQDHPDRAATLDVLGILYNEKYRKTADLNDLDAAIQNFQEAIDNPRKDEPNQGKRHENLGKALWVRYQRLSAMRDLDMAFEHFEHALRPTAPGHHDRAHHLHNLALASLEMYRASDSQKCLEITIRLSDEVVSITSDADPRRAERLEILALGCQLRYERTRSILDLDKAIRVFEESTNLMNHERPLQPKYLGLLGGLYFSKAQQTNDPSYIETSIERLHKVLSLISDSHDRANILHSLGNIYGCRHGTKEIRRTSDIEKSIEILQEATDLTPESDPERAARLHDLAAGYCARFENLGTLPDLEKAIQIGHEALRLTHYDDPVCTSRLRSLARHHCVLYERTEDISTLQAAIEYAQDGLDHAFSHTSERLLCGILALRLYASAQEWQSAYRAARTTVYLIPLLTPRFLESSRYQILLKDFAGLASDAAAAAVLAKRTPYDAIQLLELGGDIMMGSLSSICSGLSDLQLQHPKIAAEYIEYQDQLDAPQMPTQIRHQRGSVERKLSSVVRRIRNLPGFDRFLLAPTENEVKKAAVRGPIVIINVSDYTCDALIIKENQIRTIHLTRLKREDVCTRASQLESVNLELLEWLWDTIAKPVFEVLGFADAPAGQWPRIWWIPTGVLARFPIHAAGRHTDGSLETVLDRVISSYSSSLRTTLSSQRNLSPAPVALQPQKAVFVDTETRSSYSSLEFVSQEIDELIEICNSNKEVRAMKPHPARRDVLQALQDCTLFHFAGDGFFNPLDPSTSALLFDDGPLTVARLFKATTHNSRPFLAYLSICGTGRDQKDGLIGQGLHLVGACQLAGFQNVIGTLWEVNDKSRVDVAVETYTWLHKQHMNDRSASEGLHHACRKLRAQWLATEKSLRDPSRREHREVLGAGVALAVLPFVPAAVLLTAPAAVLLTAPAVVLVAAPVLLTFRYFKSPDVIASSYTPLNWVPYVHYGI